MGLGLGLIAMSHAGKGNQAKKNYGLNGLMMRYLIGDRGLTY